MIRMSREEFLAVADPHGNRLAFWLQQAWLLPTTDEEGDGFTDRDLARARLIQDLEGPLGVNTEGIDVILHLVDQIHGLRQALTASTRKEL